MSSPFTVGGLRVVENDKLTEPGEPYEVRRSLRERLFSRPWHPLRRTKTITPRVPSKHAYRTGGMLVMHPALAAELRQTLSARAAQEVGG